MCFVVTAHETLVEAERNLEDHRLCPVGPSIPHELAEFQYLPHTRVFRHLMSKKEDLEDVTTRVRSLQKIQGRIDSVTVYRRDDHPVI